jgi:uncharacterized protein YlxP (DUF503 family)
MNVGYGQIKFYLHGNRSLKGKRKIVKSMRDRVKNKFNVSISEIGDQDEWQSLKIGIAAVSSDSQYLDGLMTQVVNFIDNLHLAEMTDSAFEIIKMRSK